jgi:glycosyltransferase involved in cell wall biosynthesis
MATAEAPGRRETIEDARLRAASGALIPIRVAMFAASPIPYRVPLYQRVATDPHIDFTAIFASNGGIRPVAAGYSVPTAWDSDLLAGYRATFLKRADRNPIDGGFLAFRDSDLVGLLREGQYDVLWLWGYNYLSHQLAQITQRLLQKPVIFHEDQNHLTRRPLWKAAAKRLGLSLMLHGSKALYVGTANYRWYRRYGVKARDLYFVPHAADNDRLRTDAAELIRHRTHLRRRFGIREDSGPVILTVARIIPVKQPLMLLKAFQIVRASRRCTLLIVGSGELEGAIRAQVDKYQIPDVVMPGFMNQSEITQAYACGDIFALPSISETWGLAVNEAMNFGLPVVVSDKVGCAVDLVRDGENGYVIPFQSAEALADRIARLVDSQEMRRRFGEASTTRIQRWNYDVAAAGVRHAIADAVGYDRWAASH